MRPFIEFVIESEQEIEIQWNRLGEKRESDVSEFTAGDMCGGVSHQVH